ncbi:MAG: LysE family translocator [Ornithinimicrobium sp.]
MPPNNALLAFAFASLVLVVVPGPSVLFVVGRSLTLGRKHGLLSVLGNGLGALPLVTAVAFGLGAVLAESVVIFTTVKLLGAAYLIYLGVQAIRHRRSGLDADGPERAAAGSPLLSLRQAFVVGISNPKTIVFFAAVLPQFIDPRSSNIAAQMIVLGLVFISVALLTDSLWAIAAGSAGEWFASSPRRLSAVRATGGSMMIGLGGSLALTGSKT